VRWAGAYGGADPAAQLVGVGGPSLGRLGEQVEDDALEELGKLGPVGAGRLRRGVTVPDEHRPGVVEVEGRDAGGDLVQHTAQGVQVAAVVDLVAADLLGRHVVRGAHGDAGAGEAAGEADVLAEAGDAEVADLHRPVGEPHDIRGLQVPVDDALFMGVREGAGDLLGDVDHIGHGQRMLFVPLQQLAEIEALQQLHHQIEHALVLAEVMDDGHPAVLEGRRHPGLAAKTLPQHPGEGLVVLGSHRLEALDRDTPPQGLVASPPHLAHTPAPDDFEQPVPALDQPGFRHRVLSPPSLRRALPGPSSMAS
jgi:hypothetical protein